MKPSWFRYSRRGARRAAWLCLLIATAWLGWAAGMLHGALTVGDHVLFVAPDLPPAHEHEACGACPAAAPRAAGIGI